MTSTVARPSSPSRPLATPPAAAPRTAPPTDPPSRPWQWRWPLGALLAYLAIGVVIWAHVWFGGHPAGTAVCGCGDPAQTIWSFQWMPYALGHGLDPLFSHSLFAPDGINLVDNTSSLLPAFVLSPVTVVFGPVVAFNLALTLAPVVNAWCACAAIRPFTARRAPAFVGGLLYGFCPFVLTGSFVGHLQFAVLFFPPLLFLVLYEILVRRAWSVRRSAVTLALLLIAQFFAGTEMLALTLLVAVIGVAVLAVAYRSRVREVARTALPALAWGGGVAAVVLAVPTWFAVAGPRHFTGVQHPGIAFDGISWGSIVDPGQAAKTTVFGVFAGYSGPQGPSALYLGVILVTVLLVGVVALRRLPVIRFCAGMALLTTALAGGVAFGADIFHPPSWLAPWRLVDRLPLLAEAGPSHLAGVAMLFIAVVLAVILDRATTALTARARSGRPPWAGELPAWVAPAAVTALAVVALAPIGWAIGVPATVTPVHTPAGLTRVIDATPVGATVLFWPLPSALNARPLVWQAEAGLRFSMVGGYGFAPGPGHAKLNAANPLTPYGALAQVDVGPDGQPLSQQLKLSREEIDRSGATEAVVVPVGSAAQYSYALAFYTALLGRAPTYRPGGIWVWTGPVTTDPPLITTSTAVEFCAAFGAHSDRPLAVPECVLATAGSRRG